MSRTTTHKIAVFTITVIFFLLSGCGPGWEGYENNYSTVEPISEEPWEGTESVFVALDDLEVEVPLKGLMTYDFNSAPSVSLSELVLAAGISQTPEDFRYDFTATDDYNLLIKRKEFLLLPGWEEMKNGYLYLDSRYEDLTSGWVDHPWGSALSAYQVKFMNGGRITALPGE